jgi:hypothetical protein
MSFFLFQMKKKEKRRNHYPLGMVPSAGQTYIKNNIAYYFLKVSPLLGLKKNKKKNKAIA